MKKVFFIAAFVLVVTGCRKEESFPDEPVIETVSFRISGDTLAEWVFSFTDGDGNLGSDNDADTNYFQSLYLSSPTIDTAYQLGAERIPKINTSGITKGIEGEITKFIELDLFSFTPTDTVYFTAKVIDQAGNSSNEIRTPRFTLNPTVVYQD